MSRDDRIVKYGAVYVPEEKVKETAKRGAPKSSGKMDEIEEAIRELQDEMKKSNRDNLDAMYNIDEDNLSASYRKKIDGQFIAAYSAIRTWAENQSAGFEAVAKWQSETEDKLKGYVTQTNLDASVKSYIEDNTATLVSAVEGSFVKISTDANGKKITDTSKVLSAITQQVSDGIGKLTLSVSNGEESSTIKLMNGTTAISSKTIQMTGLVSFTDLSTKGATTINGDNITTGKISAALVDTSDLVVENVWLKLKSGEASSHKVLTSEEVDELTTSVRLGIQEQTTYGGQYIEVYGTNVYFTPPGTDPETAKDALMLDIANALIVPHTKLHWGLGAPGYEFGVVCASEFKFEKDDTSGISPVLYIEPLTGNLIFRDRFRAEHIIATT